MRLLLIVFGEMSKACICGIVSDDCEELNGGGGMVFGVAGLFKDEALQEVNATGQMKLIASIMTNRTVLFKCSIREYQFVAM